MLAEPAKATRAIAAHEQRMAALRVANEVRASRRWLRGQIAAGDLSAANVVLNPPDSLAAGDKVRIGRDGA